MNSLNAIEVRDLQKSFNVYYDKGISLKERLITRGRSRHEKRNVLNGISFDVRKGEAVGLIGKNGCGKSTTLKLLTKIIYPDKGTIEVKGRVSSLLELGAGFHPDMSGRENIYLNAAIFGLSRKEIDKKVNDIIRFSELEKFIDNPVRTYSSGMYMRLAFSVAINVNADVLLIDEILGVGDVSFQKKCFERLLDIKSSGVTIVIVSHSLEQIERICDRCIWIYDGLIREEGEPSVVNGSYYKKMEDERLNHCKEDHLNIQLEREQEIKNSKENFADGHSEMLPIFCEKTAIISGCRDVEFSDIRLIDKYKEENIVFKAGETLIIDMSLKGRQIDEEVFVTASIWRDDGILCYGANLYTEKGLLLNLREKKGIQLIFSDIKLLSGKYFLNVGLYSKSMKEYESIKRVKDFYIRSECDGKEFGIFQMEHKWK